MVKHQILLKLKKDPVLAVSLVLAVVSAFLVRPSAAYLGYIDWRVLALLAALMLAVAALGQAGLFDAVTAALLPDEGYPAAGGRTGGGVLFCGDADDQ